MKILALSFSEAGRDIGEKLEGFSKYNIKHYNNRDLNIGVRELIKRSWDDIDGLIFISASGIAVRMIQPYIKDKTKDPAVLVIDDQSRFTISLLSGHLGGANKLTEDISFYLDNTPVITTASDARGIESLDIFAEKNNYYIEDMRLLTKITRKMVDNERIGIYTDDGLLIDYPKLVKLRNLDNLKYLDGLIIVSSKILDRKINIPHIILRPRNINIGIGCRKNKEREKIIDAIESLFKKLKVSTKSIKQIGTVEIKKDEKGIIETAKHYNADMKIFTLEEISKVDHIFAKSDFVKKAIGVYSVAEPSAYLLGGEFISMKTKHDGITLSVTKEGLNG